MEETKPTNEFKLEKSFEEEGLVVCKYFEDRINHNQNVLIVTTGPTGSGKSYTDMKMGEVWYDYKFHKPFPVDHICMDMESLVRQLRPTSEQPKLLKGDFFILEEVGVNYGSQDWQNKTSKLFSYILQSFRSMNIILVMNLPTLNMLNKQCRQLLHANFITCGIDRQNNLTEIKPLFHQLNQLSGQSYWKYLPFYHKGKWITVERMRFGMPCKELIEQYEMKKHKFVDNLTEDFLQHIDKKEIEDRAKLMRKVLTPNQIEVFNLYSEGLTQQEIAEKKQISQQRVGQIIDEIELKGYSIEKSKISFRKPKNKVVKQNQNPI